MSNDITFTIFMYALATASLVSIFYTGIRHRRRMKILEELLDDIKTVRFGLIDKKLGSIKNGYQSYKDKIIVHDPISDSFEFYDKNF